MAVASFISVASLPSLFPSDKLSSSLHSLTLPRFLLLPPPTLYLHLHLPPSSASLRPNHTPFPAALASNQPFNPSVPYQRCLSSIPAQPFLVADSDDLEEDDSPSTSSNLLVANAREADTNRAAPFSLWHRLACCIPIFKTLGWNLSMETAGEPSDSVSHEPNAIARLQEAFARTTERLLWGGNVSSKKIFVWLTSLGIIFAIMATSLDAHAFVVAPNRKLQGDELATVQLFQENTPSVVYITNLASRRDAFTLDVLEVPQGSGSGFVWDKDGHVVTNYHVIRGASDLRVTLGDQSTYEAEVVGFDRDKDVAVLHIDAPKGKLRPIPVGSSGDLLVGQKVYAIGNPVSYFELKK